MIAKNPSGIPEGFFYPFKKGKIDCRILTAELGCVDLDAGAHRGSDDAALDILTLLAAAGFALMTAPIRVSKFSGQLFRAEGSLADRAVNDVGLVQTVFNLTGLRFA